MSESNSESRSVAAIVLCLAMLGAGSMLYYHLHLLIPKVLQARAGKGLGDGYDFGDDFYAIWLVARQSQAGRRDPYSAEMTREIQRGLFGRAVDPRNPSDPAANYREFAYPAFTEILLGPVTGIEFPSLRIVLAVLLPLFTAASLRLWMLAFEWRLPTLWFAVVLVLALCNYPALEAFFAEQPGLIVGFLLAGSMLALRLDRHALAGMLLSLTLIKPQMTLLAIFYLTLWAMADRSRLRFLAGFLSTTSAMIGASLWIWPHWIGEWIKVLLGYHQYAAPPLFAISPSTTLDPLIGTIAIVGLLGVGVFLAWRNRNVRIDSATFRLTLSLLLAITSLTLLPGQAFYDHIILIPGIFLVMQYQRELRNAGFIPSALLALGAVVLCWQWVAALAVVAVYPWLSPARFAAVLILPIRLATSLPFAVLALLVYATRIKLSQQSP